MRLVSLRVRLPARWWTAASDSNERCFCEPFEDAGSRCAHSINRTCPSLRWSGDIDEEGFIRCDSGPLEEGVACPLCRFLVDSGCHMDSSVKLEDGSVVWSIIAPTERALGTLVKDVRDEGAEVVVVKTTVLRTMGELTVEEERALLSAFEQGYFESPRQVDLEVLAHSLGTDKGRLEIVLGRASRKLVASRCCD